MLQVKDDNGTVTPATIDEVLAWGCWSTREVNKIYAVAAGQLRRLSTSRNGVPCDIERASHDDDPDQVTTADLIDALEDLIDDFEGYLAECMDEGKRASILTAKAVLYLSKGETP